MKLPTLAYIIVLEIVCSEARHKSKDATRHINSSKDATVQRTNSNTFSHIIITQPSITGSTLQSLGPKPPSGAAPDDPFQNYWRNLPKMLYYSTISAGIMIAAALLYRHNKQDAEEPANDGFEHKAELVQGNWRHGLFECFGDVNICCLTFCCPAIRWADTIRMAGFLGFWTALLLFAFLQLANQFTAGSLGIILLLVLIVYRQKQRQMFEMQHGTCGSYVEDCLTYCFCGCCAIVQEARHIEEAWAVKHPAIHVSSYDDASVV